MDDDGHPAFSANGVNPADIVKEFTLAGNECCIVVVKKNAKNNQGPSCSSVSSSFFEICRFEVNGQQFAVIHKCAGKDCGATHLADLLSPRELQIATLIAMGCANKQVADRLHISEWTVATYLRRIFAKLGVDTRAAMTFLCATLIERQHQSGGTWRRPRGRD